MVNAIKDDARFRRRSRSSPIRLDKAVERNFGPKKHLCRRLRQG